MTTTKQRRKKLTPAQTAHRDGIRDGLNATDYGVETHGFGPYADEYGRGVREGIKEAKEGGKA